MASTKALHADSGGGGGGNISNIRSHHGYNRMNDAKINIPGGLLPLFPNLSSKHASM